MPKGNKGAKGTRGNAGNKFAKGRPPNVEGERLEKLISFRVTDELYNQVSVAAMESGSDNVGVFLRDFLTKTYQDKRKIMKKRIDETEYYRNMSLKPVLPAGLRHREIKKLTKKTRAEKLDLD